MIRTVPGLETTVASSYQLHPTSSFPSMLGTKNGVTSHVLVMVDGVPINDAYSGFVQWNRIPKENVERVEVVRGGGATLWGTFALGGVVNVITRTPEKNQFVADGGAGSFGTFRGDLYGTPIFTDALKVSLSYNRYSTDGFNQVPSGAATPGFFPRPSSFYQPTSFRSDNLQGVANFRVDRSLSGLFRVTFHQNAQPQFIIAPQSTDQHTQNFDLQVNKLLGGDAKLTAAAFYNHGVFRTFNASFNDNPAGITAPADQGEPFLSNNHRADAKDWGGSLVWSKYFSPVVQSVSVGTDLREIHAAEHVDSFTRNFGVPVDVPDPANTGDFGGRQRFYGVFGQASLFPVSQLELAPSVRLQRWQNYDGVLLQAVSPVAPGPQPSRAVSDLSARFSARYELTRALALRGAVYKAFNAPTLDNLYRTFSANGFTIFSNPNLNPETLYGGELGFNLKAGAATWTFLAFENSIHDYIAFASDASGNFINQNLGRTRAEGFILSTDAPLTRTLSAQASYTYTRARVVSSDGHPDWIGEQLAYVPKDKLTASLTYKEGRVRSSVLARYASRTSGVNGLQFNAINPAAPLTQSAFVQDAYLVFDASAGYAFSKQLEGYVNVGNVFNRRYVANNDGFAPPLLGTPRSVFAGLRVQL